MATNTPVLDLSTKVDRQQVRIDGELYPLRFADQFSFHGYDAQAKKFGQLSVLFKKKTLTQADIKTRARLLDEICRAVLDAPSSVHRKLSDDSRTQILTVFSQLLLAKVRRVGAKATRNRSKN